MAQDGTQAQIDAVLNVIDAVLGDVVAGAYLYGSAVAGGMRPHSDLDFLVVVGEPTTRDQRFELARRLRPISRRDERPADWRPVELTTVAATDSQARARKPTTDFQYGEWLRDDFDAGRVDPAEPHNPDLVVVLAQVRAASECLRGKPAAELIAEVPDADLRRAMRDSVADLMANLETDTTNVLLTLARIWYSLETNGFTSKDTAADWAAARIRAGDSLRRAGAIYRGEAPDEWRADEAALVAAELTEGIGA